MRLSKKNLVKIASYSLVLIAFYYIYITFSKINYIKIKTSLTFLNIFLFTAFGILYSFLVFLRAYNWKKILDFITHQKNQFSQLIPIYLRTEIAKYIPSNVMHFAGRHVLAKQLGYKNSSLILSNILDMGLVFFSSISITLLGISIGSLSVPQEILNLISLQKILGIISIICLILIVLLYINRSKVLNKIKKYLSSSKILELTRLFLQYIPFFFTIGIILYFIFSLLNPLSFTVNNYIYILSGFSVSWALGFIIPGAPGGLGIREAIIIIIFSENFGEGNALIAGLILRAITIGGDVFAFLYSYIFNRIKKTHENLTVN